MADATTTTPTTPAAPTATPSLKPSYDKLCQLAEWLYKTNARLLAANAKTITLPADSINQMGQCITLCLVEMEKCQPAVMAPAPAATT